MRLWRNRFLGGVSLLPLPDAPGAPPASGDGAGTGGGAAAGTGAPAATKVDAGTTGAGASGGAAGAAAATAGDKGAAADGGTKQAGTLASGAEGTAAAAAAAKAPPTFPDNWRAQLAGDDKAALAQLERFGSPNDIWKAYRELQSKVSAGELKAAPKPLDPKATPEQAAAWRKDNGIPEKPEDYKIELPNGVVVGESDKPLVDNFVKYAHGNNMPPGVVNQALGWYYQMQDALVAQRLEADDTFHTDSTVALKQEWGSEFKGNINAVTSVLNMFPEQFRSALEHARTPDGQQLGDHPEFNRALLQIGKMINPASTLLPAAAGAGLGGVETRIAEIEGVMRDPAKSDQYWKGEGGAKMQGELRELYAARENMKKRSAA